MLEGLLVSAVLAASPPAVSPSRGLDERAEPPAAAADEKTRRRTARADSRPGPSVDSQVEPGAEDTAVVFSNTAQVDIPSGQPGLTNGPASPYPSTITVGGPLAGSVTKVEVKLAGLTHGFPDDVDVLLVSPHGSAIVLMSDACGSTDLAGVDLWFSEPAKLAISDSGPCFSSVFETANYEPDDSFSAPAPAGPYESGLAAFDGENANGTWRLYVYDDFVNDSGYLAGGWELTLETNGWSYRIPGSGTSGTALSYPEIWTIYDTSARNFGPILDVDVSVSGFWHQRPDDVDMLLVGPNGKTVMLMSDACGSTELENASFVFDDEAPAGLSDADGSGCASGHVRPTDFEPGESLPAPAPAGPYSTALSVFDGDDPVGTWSLFVRDDATDLVGFVESPFAPTIRTVGIFRDGFEYVGLCLWSARVPPVVCG